MVQTTPQPTKRPPQTVKEKRFAQEYIANGGNATQAALKAYDTDSPAVAAEIGSQNLRRLDIVDELENAGLTDKKLAEAIYYGVQAFKRAGLSSELVEDWSSRAKFVEIALKLKGHLKDKTDDVKILNFYQFLMEQQQRYEVPGVYPRQLTDSGQERPTSPVSPQSDSNEVPNTGLSADSSGGEDASSDSQSPSAGVQQSDSRDVHDGLSTDPEQSISRGS